MCVCVCVCVYYSTDLREHLTSLCQAAARQILLLPILCSRFALAEPARDLDAFLQKKSQGKKSESRSRVCSNCIRVFPTHHLSAQLCVCVRARARERERERERGIERGKSERAREGNTWNFASACVFVCVCVCVCVKKRLCLAGGGRVCVCVCVTKSEHLAGGGDGGRDVGRDHFLVFRVA
jgi:hypothetical protein